MNQFLSDYITSIASRSQKRFQDILRSAFVSKEQADQIAVRLANLSDRAPILVRPQAFGGLIDSANIDSIYRDVNLKFRELYSDSNEVSLLLDSHTEILSSEIKKQSDQLDAFEKFIDNYNFMLADQGFFDHGYTESFSDDIQQQDSPMLDTMLYDRSGTAFDKNSEALEIDQSAGILTMSASFDASYPLTGRLLGSNAEAFATSNTGIENSITSTVGDGWRVSISSPRPIISSIYENAEKGAQYEIEYSLDAPAPADVFAMTPLADVPCYLISLKVYSEEDSNPTELIRDSVYLDKNKNFYFEQQIVSRVVLVLNQPIYVRGKLSPVSSEEAYKQVFEQQRVEKALRPEKRGNQKAFQRLFSKWFLTSEKKRAKLVRPVPNISKYTDKIDLQEAISYEKEAANVYSSFKFRGAAENIFDKWIADKLFKDQPDLLGRFSKPQNSEQSKVDVPVVLSPTNELVEAKKISSQNYEYSLGIRNVKIGITTNKYRGVFISKPVPSPVQSGEVRIKVDELNYDFANSFLDNPQVTVIEYSVTNRPNPSSEKDWIPIVPTNEVTDEITERAFPQSSGYAPLRIPASNRIGISLYKNGLSVGLENTAIVRSNDNLSAIGVRIPASEFSLNPDDVYTVRYIPIGDPTTINFGDRGFPQNDLASAFDDNGAGELFNTTGGSRSVSLSNFPFVDSNQLEEEATYSSTYGLVGSYQPITIVLEDGTIAYNYTNYFGLAQNALNESNSDYTFLHSGREIIFNKDVTQNFRVYYQYEPSYVRYRIIFRINSPVKVSPSVNSLTMKMKLNASILGQNEKKV